jgi:hypothetical protein
MCSLAAGLTPGLPQGGFGRSGGRHDDGKGGEGEVHDQGKALVTMY